MREKDGKSPKSEALILRDDPGTGLRRGDTTTNRERAERAVLPHRVKQFRDSQNKGKSR